MCLLCLQNGIHTQWNFETKYCDLVISTLFWQCCHGKYLNLKSIGLAPSENDYVVWKIKLLYFNRLVALCDVEEISAAYF